MFKRVSLGFFALASAYIVAWQCRGFVTPYNSSGKDVSISLNRGSLPVLEFIPKKPDISAIVIFASGDGGWSSLEEEISRSFQTRGYEVIGIDSAVYAKPDYDLAILQADFSRIVQKAELAHGNHRYPVIIGGYSMGAGQAIAVAGGPHRPEGLAGLLLVDPCSRGRYGLHISDQLDVLPTGPGTFSMKQFADKMVGLRIVQCHASDDTIDSRAWLDGVTASHREIDFENEGHAYGRNRDEFILRLVESMQWILSGGHDGPMALENTKGEP